LRGAIPEKLTKGLDEFLQMTRLIEERVKERPLGSAQMEIRCIEVGLAPANDLIENLVFG
jgi:hypothetical protein